MNRFGVIISTVLLTATAVHAGPRMASLKEVSGGTPPAAPAAPAPAQQGGRLPSRPAPAAVPAVAGEVAKPAGAEHRAHKSSPLAAARLAPADVTALIHVTNAARIRKELADRPIARWMTSVATAGQSGKAWSRLAKAANLSEGEMLDFVMGERFTLMIRAVPAEAAAKRDAAKDQRDALEWALVTGVDEQRAARMLRSLKVKVLEPRAGFAIAELPEEDIIIARDEHHLVVGPRQRSPLFYEILPRLGVRSATSLADDAAFAKIDELGDGCAGAFVRHTRDMGGGWSCLVADLDGDQLAIKHAAHFDHAPFMHGVTKLTCDASPVKAFEQRALLAMIQPTDIGDGPFESFLIATLNDGLISREMRRNTGQRRLMVVGEEDVRLNEQRAPAAAAADAAKAEREQAPMAIVNMPTLVTCIELKDREIAPDQLDRQMERWTRKINQLGEGAFLLEVPQACRLRQGEPRHVDLSPALAGFAGGFPIMKNVSLNWTVAEGQDAAWFVIGTHPRSMQDVVKSLQTGCESDPRFKGRFDSAGSANGTRLGRHLENWSEHASKIAPVENAENLRTTLQLMSQLASGLQTCRWQLARPTDKDMRLDVQVTLSPPESSR